MVGEGALGLYFHAESMQRDISGDSGYRMLTFKAVKAGHENTEKHLRCPIAESGHMCNKVPDS